MRLTIQRSTAHKLRNLEGKGPGEHAPGAAGGLPADELRRERGGLLEQARQRSLRKWRLACPLVAASMHEAGGELFTLFKVPQSPWKALRTTNALERNVSSSAVAPRPRPRCRASRPSCSCSSACCAPVRSQSHRRVPWDEGRRLMRSTERRMQRHHAFQPIDRHLTDPTTATLF